MFITGIMIVSYGILVFPMLHFFLLKKINAGIGWNVGLHHEFLFPAISGLPLGGKVFEIVHFFSKAFFITFGAMIGVIPENHPLFPLITWILLSSFFIGVIHFLWSRDKRIKTMGFFLFFWESPGSC